MAIDTIRRLAADILGIGERKVRISPDGVKEASQAMTRSDVRGLIEKGIITRAPIRGRRRHERGKRSGEGKRRGTAKTRQGGKEVWMAKVRSQRAFLRQIVSEDALPKKSKRMIYMRIKSGLFRSKRAFLAYLKENGLVKQDYEPKKVVWTPKQKRVQPQQKQAPKPAQQQGQQAKPVASPAQKPAAKPQAQPQQKSKEGVKQ